MSLLFEKAILQCLIEDIMLFITTVVSNVKWKRKTITGGCFSYCTLFTLWYYYVVLVPSLFHFVSLFFFFFFFYPLKIQRKSNLSLNIPENKIEKHSKTFLNCFPFHQMNHIVIYYLLGFRLERFISTLWKLCISVFCIHRARSPLQSSGLRLDGGNSK